MITDTLIKMFAMLAIVGVVFIVAVIVLALVARFRGGLPEWAIPLRDGFSELALPLAFCVALVCTLGSLYLSEVKHLPPCDMCWYQRICMYPSALILGIAAVRRDIGIRWYIIPLAAVGVALSTYHRLIELFPDSVASSCTNDVPCSTVWVEEFGFLTIPTMAGIGFLLIITLLLLARPACRLPTTSHPTPNHETRRSWHDRREEG